MSLSGFVLAAPIRSTGVPGNDRNNRTPPTNGPDGVIPGSNGKKVIPITPDTIIFPVDDFKV
ncbi:uncharacterized protein G6M90_00g108570 [Metarhizium brunneum]|uniref:Uncharacterized protein n=1 Tax=Metarhizium brunneum TaxID=500148 RepID=A0A7D5ZCA2_9HYPO